jgi:GNAT superfamily N-acetyltransferase
MTPLIRPASEADAGAVADLLPHLGYEVTQQVAQRLARLLSSRHHAVVVAQVSDQLVGLCMLAVVSHLATSGYAEVLELVVNAAVQGQGVGTSLLREGEAWARRQGCQRVRLRSGVHRTEAHQFYERRGYSRAKASLAFERLLGE